MDDASPIAEIKRKRTELAEIAPGRIAPDRGQQRRRFDLIAMSELTESVRIHGVVQPIVLRPFREGEREADSRDAAADFRIIAGERRWRAASEVGLDSIPCVIRHDLTDDEVIVIQAIENLQRADLTLEEEANACALLSGIVGLEATAKELSKSKGWVSLRAGIISMPMQIRELVTASVVRDAQIVHMLGQIWRYDEAHCRTLIKLFIDPPAYANGNTPTRADVQNSLNVAKARAQIAQQKAETAAEGDEEQPITPTHVGIDEGAPGGDKTVIATSDGDAVTVHESGGSSYQNLLAQIGKLTEKREQLAKQEVENQQKAKADAAAEKAKKRRAAIEKLNPKMDQFAQRARINLSEALGATIPRRMDTLDWDRNLPVTAIPKQRLEASGKDDLPADESHATYRVFLNAQPEVFRPLRDVALTFTLSAKLEGLSVDQAIAIKKIIGADVAFGTDIQIMGRELLDVIADLKAPKKVERVAPKQIADPVADLAQWIKTNIAKKSGARLTSGEAHQRYSQDCAKRGIEPISLFSHRWKNTFLAEGIQSIRSDGTSFIDVQFKGDRK